MLAVKLSASDIRVITAARSVPEMEGAISLVKDRILQAEAIKKMTEPAGRAKKGYPFAWEQCLKVAVDELGSDQVVRPPFPDPTWFSAIGRVCREYQFTEEYFRRVCVYARENLRAPYNLKFLVTQHEKILSGHYSYPDRQGREGTAGKSADHLASLPRLVADPEPDAD